MTSTVRMLSGMLPQDGCSTQCDIVRDVGDIQYLFIYLFTIFKQACPVQHGWFKWRPVKNSIIQIN